VNLIVFTQLSRTPTLHIPKLSNLSRVVLYTKKNTYYTNYRVTMALQHLCKTLFSTAHI